MNLMQTFAREWWKMNNIESQFADLIFYLSRGRNFIFGFMMAWYIDKIPIQYINANPIREYSVSGIIIFFMIFCLSSIIWNFYTPKVKTLIQGISVGSFLMATIQIFKWVFGEWELISSTFSIIFSLYLSSLFVIFDTIHNFKQSYNL